MEKNKKRKGILDLPMCKYGSSCYQKNPDHRKKFKHLESNQLEISPNVQESSKDENDNSKYASIPTPDVSCLAFVGETVVEVLKSMPEDFLEFWNFCSSLNESKPEDAFAEMGLHLVGVYDVLSRKLPKDKEVKLQTHWRYYYDPPEFQTVIKLDDEDLYHIGYFRDDPSELPAVLASNCAAIGPKLTLMGDNIFAAVNNLLKEELKKLKAKKLKNRFSKIQVDLQNFAAAKKYCLELQTSKTKARSKKVVTKTFHGLGIVVPVKNDIGYRELPDTDAKLKSILKKIVNAEDDIKRLQEEEQLDEIITNMHFANDECDYGMGLELGIDLFSFGHPYLHSHVLSILTLAYNLLKRSKYGEILKAHLSNRRKDDKFNELDI